MPSLRFGGIDFGAAAIGAAGAVGSEMLTGLVAGVVPLEQLKSGPGRLLLKAGTIVTGVMLARQFAGAKLANQLAVGAGIGLMLDGYRMIAATIPGLPAMGAYALDGVGEDYAPVPGNIEGLVAPGSSTWTPAWGA